MRMLGWPGSVGALNAGGAAQPFANVFDFVGAPDSEYFEFIEQADAVIGMRSIDSLEYAPHALQAVWSNPDNLAPHSNDFLDPAWIKQGSPPVVIRQINESEFQFDQVAGSSDLVQIIERGKVDQPYTTAYFFPDQDNDALPAWLRIIELSLLDGQDRYEAWYRVADKTVGTIQPGANGGNAIAAGWDRDDARGGWWWYLTGNPTIHSNVSTSISTAIADGSTTRDAGSQFIFRDCWIYPGTLPPTQQMATQSPYVETGSVGALDNWSKTGPAEAVLYLTYDKGRVRYAFDNTGGAADAQWDLQAFGNLIAGLPYTVGIEWYGTGQARLRVRDAIAAPLFETLPDEPTPAQTTTIPTTNGASIVEVAPGGICYGILPETCEGSELFGLETKGFPRYLLRRKQTVGAQFRPQQENRVYAGTLYPDLSNINDSVNTTTTAVDRADLPAAMLAQVEAEDTKGNILGFYRTEFSSIGRVYAVGPAANTNTHWLGAWTWLETGSAELAVENVNIAAVQQTQVFEYTGKSGTPLAASDRLAFEGTAGTVLYWAAMDYNPYNQRSAHIPTGGSARIQLEDRPVTTVEACGLDPRRNSAPNSSSEGAALGPLSGAGSVPTGWAFPEANGWEMEVVGIHAGGIDVKFTGTAAGSIYPRLHEHNLVAAQSGDERTVAVELSLIDGDLTNVNTLLVVNSERDALGAFIAGAVSSLPVNNLVSSTPRRFSQYRSYDNGATAFSGCYLEIDGTGVVDFTLRITDWSNQKSAKLLPHLETTGTAVAFQQWVEGLTIQERWDVDARIGDEAWSFWEMYGSDRGLDRIQLIADQGGADPDFPRLQWIVDGQGGGTRSIVYPGSVIGENAIQSAFADGDEELWVNGDSAGTRTTGLPSDLSHICIGNRTAASRSRNGVCQSLTFIGERKTGASGFSEGFNDGFN